jgi:membrane protein YqaA with SNARE-associated domain
MNYLDILLPIGLILFGGLVAYLIGFIIGRRSAYQDVDQNLNATKKMNMMKKTAGPQGIVHSQFIK